MAKGRIDNPGGVLTEIWNKIERIDIKSKAKLSKGKDQHAVTCQRLQKAYDVLVEASSEPLREMVLRQWIPDKLLEIAVSTELRWLPPEMAPDLITPTQRSWLMELLDLRLRHYMNAAAGRPFGQEFSKPRYIVLPRPKTSGSRGPALDDPQRCTEGVARKKRGRPTEIPEERKRKALGVNDPECSEWNALDDALFPLETETTASKAPGLPRGRPPKTRMRETVRDVARKYGQKWSGRDNLIEIACELDNQAKLAAKDIDPAVEVPPKWKTLRKADGKPLRITTFFDMAETYPNRFREYIRTYVTPRTKSASVKP